MSIFYAIGIHTKNIIDVKKLLHIIDVIKKDVYYKMI